MMYIIKVGQKYLIGESATETLSGTHSGSPTAVFSTICGQMQAYEFTDDVEAARHFDRMTATGYIEGLLERQAYGFYTGEIKIFDASEAETIVHCKSKRFASQIASMLDEDGKLEEDNHDT